MRDDRDLDEMRRALHAAPLVLIASLACSVALSSGGSDPFPAVRMAGKPPIYELRNGYWFDGRTFVADTRYTIYGAITARRPEPVD